MAIQPQEIIYFLGCKNLQPLPQRCDAAFAILSFWRDDFTAAVERNGLPDRYMEITDPASAPTFSFPFVLDCLQFYELMVAQGEGRSPMTSSGAETDSKPIIVLLLFY